MPSSYSDDFRRSVINYVEQGHSRCAAARVFGTSHSFVIKLMQRYKSTGCFSAYKRGVFHRIFEAVSDDLDMEYAMVDATIVPVHRHGYGAQGLKIRPSGSQKADVLQKS